MVCDAMVRRFLPSMRAEMVSRLVHRQGLSQSDAAKRLGVTRAAVSQYLSRKRGDADLEISDDMNVLLDRWAMAVAGSQDCITLCDICECTMKHKGNEGQGQAVRGEKRPPEFSIPSSSDTTSKGKGR